MANAKRCDICGKYYIVPEGEVGMLWDESMNTSMIRILRHRPDDKRKPHDVMQFDSCEKCLQDTLDYFLSRRAEWDKSDAK
ncbi:MAG: hypothetical protein IIV94_10340 [Clostridiales bacterium]|nr:hypothetical protein [Clostridiales bacterium]